MRRRAATCLVLLLGLVGIEPATARPTRYSEFHSVARPEELGAALAAHANVYLPPGRYVVDNPIVVDRDTPLFIHGGNRRATTLVPRNPGAPLIVLRRAPLLNLSQLRLAPGDGAEGVDAVALRAENGAPTRVEIEGCNVDAGSLELRGPGRFHVQGTWFHPRGRVRAPVVLDHPGASLVVIGGNISNGKHPPRFEGDEAYHMWQKRGRLRVYGTGLQATLGRADLRIDSPSRDGPHLVSHVRSEGNNGARRGELPSVLLRVPPSQDAVDVVVEASGGAWGRKGLGLGRFVDYNAAGTVWLLANHSATGAARLVTGKLGAARIAALGNVYQGSGAPLPPGPRVALDVGNLGYLGRGLARPLRNAVLRRGPPPGEAALALLGALPAIPAPEPLVRPVLDLLLPGTTSVVAFGARGDGIHDDTAALQRALDAGCGGPTGKLLYLPAGTYRITRRLLFNHPKAACQQHRSGGWIGGAGSERTVIRRDGPGGVFTSHGMAQTTVQGLAFRTVPFADAPSQREAAFSLENDPAIGHASQAITFSDVAFDGGRQGLGFGLETPTNCSENLVVDGTFRNAHVGLAAGSYNALANLVWRGRFEDNDVAVGHDEETLSGGTFGVYGATVRGTRLRDVALRNSAGGVFLLSEVDSDSTGLLGAGVTGAIFPVLVRDSRWSATGAVGLEFAAGGGLVFQRSSVARLAAVLRAPLSSNFLLGIGGAVHLVGDPRKSEHSLVWGFER